MKRGGQFGVSRPDLAERNRQRATHGLTKSPTWNVWNSMKQRCNNPSSHMHANYGARGIRVCARWEESFECFLADMGSRPEGMQIDRIDNDGNYEPGNCRWATPQQNCRNRRSNVLVEYRGVSRPIAEWAEIVGLERKTLQYRVRAGWSAEKALNTPSTTNRKKTNGHFAPIDQQDAA